MGFLKWNVGVCLIFFIPASFLFAQGTTPGAKRGDFPASRRMVDEVLRPINELSNETVLDAVASIPRHFFVPDDLQPFAYQDLALPIGDRQTISPPFIVAYMTEKIDPKPTDKVLEIGTGSGYQAAVLSPLVAEVYTIEIKKNLGKRAESALKKIGFENVHCRIGDGYKGWSEAAPFDKIIVTCSPEAIPQPLIDQLREGGSILIPLGDRYHQYFYLCTKHGNELTKEVLMPAFFVPMTGQAESERQVLPDPKNPTIEGGDFEQVNKDGKSPVGWYYTRNVTVEERDNAPQGKSVLVFDNKFDDKKGSDNPEELTAHLMQPFPVNGMFVPKLDLSCWMKGAQLKSLYNRQTIALLAINFFDADRNTLGEQVVIAVHPGSFNWTKMERFDIEVPRKAVEGSVRLGILEGTGRVEVDAITLKRSSTKK